MTGASGQLGGHIVRSLRDECSAADILALGHAGECGVSGAATARMDLADLEALPRYLEEFRPTYVLHVGAMTAVGDCYTQPELATRVNTEATGVLAEEADALGARLVFSSTDMVFGGDAAPYSESDSPSPLSHYGRTKAAAECKLAPFERHLVVRIPLMYGFAVTPRRTTFASQVAALRKGEPLRLFTDEYRTPVWLEDAAAALIALARSDVQGVIHVSGPERLSRFEMVERFARRLGIVGARLEPISRLSIDAPEPRPADLSLEGSRFAQLFPASAPGPISRATLAGALGQ